MSHKKPLFETLSDYLKKGISPTHKETEIWEEYGKKVAVLVIDSSGFSKNTLEHGIIHALTNIAELIDIADKILKKNGAMSQRILGDNIFAEFFSVDEAIKASIEIKLAINSHSFILKSSVTFGANFGIGYGNLLFSERFHGYYGEEMNLASKLGEDIAADGEILITKQAFQKMQAKDKYKLENKKQNMSGIEIAYFKIL
jgi:adenylate cyclase